jgi:hypothetical protein
MTAKDDLEFISYLWSQLKVSGVRGPVSVSLQGTIENIYSSQPIISDAGNPVDMVSDSYQILIGLLLCCCFPDVFWGKQQASSNPAATW